MSARIQVIILDDGYITFGFGLLFAKYRFTRKDRQSFWEERIFKVEMYYRKPQNLFLVAISLQQTKSSHHTIICSCCP